MRLPCFDLDLCRSQELYGALETILGVGDARETDQTFGKLIMYAGLLVKKKAFGIPGFGVCIIFLAYRNRAQHPKWDIYRKINRGLPVKGGHLFKACTSFLVSTLLERDSCQ